VVHPDDFTRFATLGLIASVQPPHAVEDMPWAAERIGPDRVRGAYAWRTFRRAGVPLVFSSDLPGSRWSLFYGLHSAIAREDTAGQPPGGWFPEQRMTPEEAVRGYTSWGASAGFDEGDAGAIIPGMRADLTALSMDPLRVTSPADLLSGTVRLTVVGGRVVR
jgi:predicted amidohydrolase YtcJ